MLLRRGSFEQSALEDLQDVLAGLQPSGRRLVVHFHGGLVDRKHGMAIAERLTPIYEQAGGYPLFVLWRSGFAETVTSSLRSVAQENIFRRLLARVIQFTLSKARRERDGDRAIDLVVPRLDVVYKEAFGGFEGEPYAQLDGEFSELGETQEHQIERTLRRDHVIQDETDRIVRALTSDDGDRAAGTAGIAVTLMSPEVLQEMIGDGPREGDRSVFASARVAKGALMTVKRVLSRLRSGRGHGVYCTAIEELLREFYVANVGGSLWRQMKRDTELSFGSDAHRFGGTALLAELAAIDPATTPLLVGHSTGALYICNLLARADIALPSERTFDVAMLAPACDFDAMDRTLVRHGRRVGRLRIFSMSDEHEREDRLVPGVYPRSLLYFVSGVLENEADWPLLGMQRFHTVDPPFSGEAFPAIGRVRDQLAARANSSVWSIATGGPGLCSKAVRHGDFDDDPVTLESVAQLVGGN